MTLLVQAANIDYAHGGSQIFQDVSFEIRAGDRLALIGENGAGKSTLFRMIARQIKPDGGVVTHARNLNVGYLSQEPVFGAGLTPRDALAAALGDPAGLEQQLRELERRMETAADDGELSAAYDAYTDCLTKLELAGGQDMNAKISERLSTLGLTDSRWDVPVERLSGGEKKLVGLAQLLVAEPDLLLLDEPDNHLDHRGKEVLERIIVGHRGAVALVSHDRWFINLVVNRIFELEDGRIVGYPGNYRAYVIEKRARLERAAQLRELQVREFKKLKASAEQLTQWARQNPKFASRAENQRRKLAEERSRLEETPAPLLDRRRIEVGFEAERGGTLVLEASGLTKSHGESVVFAPFDLLIRHGERVGLVGPNGAGKTTLFRLILGSDLPTGGTLRVGSSIIVGYYSQEQETLDPRQTSLELVRKLKPMTEQAAIGFLGGFLFDRDDAINRIASLSGGERARLQIAALILQGANFLLLDEPTNNLDLPSIEALESALLSFSGTILAISHDRYFLDQVCDRIVELDGGIVRDYAGGFSYYDAHRGRGKELTIRPPPPSGKSKPGKPRR